MDRACWRCSVEVPVSLRTTRVREEASGLPLQPGPSHNRLRGLDKNQGAEPSNLGKHEK